MVLPNINSSSNVSIDFSDYINKSCVNLYAGKACFSIFVLVIICCVCCWKDRVGQWQTHIKISALHGHLTAVTNEDQHLSYIAVVITCGDCIINLTPQDAHALAPLMLPRPSSPPRYRAFRHVLFLRTRVIVWDHLCVCDLSRHLTVRLLQRRSLASSGDLDLRRADGVKILCVRHGRLQIRDVGDVLYKQLVESIPCLGALRQVRS